MKQINSRYNGNHDSIYLIYMGDLHIGNKYMNYDYINQVFNFIDANRDRCRLILMGDQLECATKTSVGRSVFEESFNIDSQFDLAARLFTRYADIIDLVLDGNHEDRIMQSTSLEITEKLTTVVGCRHAYGKFQGVVRYRMHTGMIYTTYCWHGATGGTKDASALNALLAMRNNCTAHIYAMGHTHKLMYVTREHFIPGDKKLVTINQGFINTGTALDYGGYGEQKNYEKGEIGFGCVEIFADQRKMVFHRIKDLL